MQKPKPSAPAAPSVSTKPKLEGPLQLEKDGAPKGYTYRLLLRDHKVHGLKGHIITLDHAAAKTLDGEKDAACTPSPAQIARGVR